MIRLTIEKVLILKTVEIFSETPEENLAELASILEEIEIEAGETIFEKGDIGKTMYVIIQGKIRIHDGDQTIMVFGERDFFGELSVLDPEPRSASATVLEDAILFQIDQEALYEIMADHIEVARGIISALCKRVRNTGR